MERLRFCSPESGPEALETKYVVALESGVEGWQRSTLRAEINLGLKRGYAGFLQEKEEVISFLKETYRSAVDEGRNYIPVGVQQSEIVYAYPSATGAVADAEPALTLFSDKSPLYAVSMSDVEWQVSVEDLASRLADKFGQFRVYVTYTRVEVKVFQRRG